jgi:CspA family cold shock protein
MILNENSDNELTRISGVVKWYDSHRGFGFVVSDDLRSDAFLHVTILKKSGVENVSEGDRLICAVSTRDKGFIVEEVEGVERSGAENIVSIRGTVRFYDTRKGYGFVKQANGGDDIFVGFRALDRSGLESLQEDQPVLVVARQGNKGLSAQTVSIVEA